MQKRNLERYCIKGEGKVGKGSDPLGLGQIHPVHHPWGRGWQNVEHQQDVCVIYIILVAVCVPEMCLVTSLQTPNSSW